MTEECSFCARLAGRGFWIVVEERPHGLAYVANHQRSRGSLLLIPRRHVPSLMELTEDEASDVLLLIRRTTLALERSYDPEGMHVWYGGRLPSNDFHPHLHVRVCPRFAGEPYSFGTNESLPVATLDERYDVLDRVRRELAGIPEDAL